MLSPWECTRDVVLEALSLFLISTCRPAVADSSCPTDTRFGPLQQAPQDSGTSCLSRVEATRTRSLSPSSQSLRLHMTSTMVAIIGARRGPKEGTCNEGAHYQWLTASTLLGTGAAESCNGRFSVSRAGIAVDWEVTLAQHDRCHHQG